MANFSFLKNRPEYALFAAAAMEAERVYASSPAMCAVGCRKALELAVKWVYSADQELERPYQENLQALLHESTFQFTVDPRIWERLSIIIRLGNLAVHTGRTISSGDALLALQTLFDFIHWIDYSYGTEYEERSFDEHLLPQEKVSVDT